MQTLPVKLKDDFRCEDSERSSCEQRAWATCFRVLILCRIATPTGQLTRRLLYRMLHQHLLLRLGNCGLCAALSVRYFVSMSVRYFLVGSFVLLYSVL